MIDLGLTDLEHDALSEIINVAVSKAAVSLRDMVGEQVHLSVPHVELISRHQAAEILRQRESEDVAAVYQSFDGDLAGRAMLILPEDRSLGLARTIAVHTAGVVTEELEAEALSETGNVVLGSCVATMANMLERTLTISLPVLIRAHVRELFESDAPHEQGVLFASIDFDMRKSQVSGYVAIVMDMQSLTALGALLREFMERVMAQD